MDNTIAAVRQSRGLLIILMVCILFALVPWHHASRKKASEWPADTVGHQNNSVTMDGVSP